MSKILIVGASGFIGKRIYSSLVGGFDVFGTGNTNRDFDNLDITSERDLEEYILAKIPETIIWLSGKDTPYCENNPVEGFKVNVMGLYYLLNILKTNKIKSKIIYISSDRIFDGKRGNYTESDPVSPTTNYAFTKKICETMLRKSDQDYKVIRVSAVFGRGGVFTEWVIGCLNSKTKAGIFSNSYFTPTPINLICENIECIIHDWESIPEKIIHLSGGERMSRFEFASLIAKKLNIEDPPIFADLNKSFVLDDVSLIPSKMIKFRMSFEEYISKELKK